MMIPAHTSTGYRKRSRPRQQRRFLPLPFPLMLIAGLVAASIRSSPGLVVNARSISHAATLSNLQETAIEFSTATATTMYTEELDAVCEWEADCKVEDEWDEDCKDEDCEDDPETMWRLYSG